VSKLSSESSAHMQLPCWIEFTICVTIIRLARYTANFLQWPGHRSSRESCSLLCRVKAHVSHSMFLRTTSIANILQRSQSYKMNRSQPDSVAQNRAHLHDHGIPLRMQQMPLRPLRNAPIRFRNNCFPKVRNPSSRCCDTAEILSDSAGKLVSWACLAECFVVQMHKEYDASSLSFG